MSSSGEHDVNVIVIMHVCTGIGFGICMMASYVAFYYNTIMAWSLYYIFATIANLIENWQGPDATHPPWSTCGHPWNTERCAQFQQRTKSANRTGLAAPLVEPAQQVPSSQEYYERAVLEMYRSHGLSELGGVKWSIALCLGAIFTMVFFALWKGIKSSGKAVWITAIMPYVCLLALFLRGITLPGAFNGLLYYVKPDMKALQNIEIWNDAASQVLFSLGPGFGVLLALSSYNRFHNNCYTCALSLSFPFPPPFPCRLSLSTSARVSTRVNK